MFDNIIRSTQFTSDTAVECFGRIHGDTFRGDYTFLSVLRAFLGERMPKNEDLYLAFTEQSMVRVDLTAAPRDVVSQLTPSGISNSNCIIIHSLRGSKEDTAQAFDVIAAEFTKANPRFAEFEKFHYYYKPAFLTRLYIDPDRKTSVVFVDRMSVKTMHALAVGIPVMLPWYFSAERGMTPDEMALIQSLGQTDPVVFENALNKLAAHYDFRTMRIKKQLAGFETRSERKRIESLENELQGIIEKINRYNNEIGNLIRSQYEKNITLFGLQQKVKSAVSEEDSEIMQYFLANENVYLDRVSDHAMTFSVRGYLDFFDDDAAETAIENDASVCYDYTNYSDEDTKRLLRAIFVDRKIRLRFCAAYEFDLQGQVTGLNNHEFEQSVFGTYMPNPHIQQYHCLGNYAQQINLFLQQQNYIGAIEQCIASCISLNWNDWTVIKKFLSVLLQDAWGVQRCIELPDGSVVSAADAIEWLKAQA